MMFITHSQNTHVTTALKAGNPFAGGQVMNAKTKTEK
jgi:hypothetical protein